MDFLQHYAGMPAVYRPFRSSLLFPWHFTDEGKAEDAVVRQTLVLEVSQLDEVLHEGMRATECS